MLDLLLSFWKDPMVYVLGGFVLIFGFMIFAQTRKRRSAQSEYSGMLETLRPGNRVKTVGGVIGTIKEIRQEAPGFKTVLLETGDPKNPSLVLYDLQAIYGIVDDEKLAAAKASSTPSTDSISQPQSTSVSEHTTTYDGVEYTQGFQKTKKTKSKGK